MLQQKIASSEDGDKFKVQTSAFYKCLTHQILPLMSEVIVNQFGNYLCQKIIECADPIILQAIINQINDQLVFMCLNVHGTRAVQTLVEKLAHNVMEELIVKNQAPSLKFANSFNLNKVIASLNEHIVDLTLNMHGNHVLQQFLMVFNQHQDMSLEETQLTELYTEFIFEACMQNVIAIGKHKHGCCVMQRCLEKGTWKQKVNLANFIIKDMNSLIEDPYGNYLIQNVIKLNDRQKNQHIFQEIAKDFIRLSQLKFSSNVIEKCLDSCLSDGKEPQIEKVFKGTLQFDDQQMVNELVGCRTDMKTRVNFIVQKLIYNQFGNYVIQKVLAKIKDDHLRTEILYTIKSLQPSLM